jgi:hypothetical protein
MSETHFRGRVIQDGQIVAQVLGGDFDAVDKEGAHYLMMYAQDGPAVLQIAEKRNKRWRLLGGSVACIPAPPAALATPGGED